MTAMDLKDLQEKNPWKDFGYHVTKPELKLGKDGKGWFCEKDRKPLEDENIRGAIKPRFKRLRLSPNPVPWAGRWNSSDLPRFVILSLNPGSGYENDNNDGRSLAKGDDSDDEFSRLTNLNLNGEAGMSDHIFSTAVFSRSGYIPKRRKDGKKVSYWVEKLYPLYKESVDNPMTKEQLYQKIESNGAHDENDGQFRQAKDFFDGILTVELFPYHTSSANQIGALFKDCNLIYPSSQFNVDLVRYMISKGVTVVVARSWSLWAQALGVDINKSLRLNSPQNTVISRGNLGDNWDMLIAKFKSNPEVKA